MDVMQTIKDILQENLEIDQETVTADSTLDDLGIDSLSMLLLSLAAEHKFNMQFDSTTAPFETVGDVCDYIVAAVK